MRKTVCGQSDLHAQKHDLHAVPRSKPQTVDSTVATSESKQVAGAALLERVENVGDEQRFMSISFLGMQELAEDAAEEMEGGRQDSGSDDSRRRGRME